LPILLQEVRRRPPLRRKRFLGVPLIYLVYAAVCSGVLAAWIVRPGGGLSPVRTATIRVMPQMLSDSASAGKQGQAPHLSAATRKLILPPQPELDRNPVGTIETPYAPARAFSEVKRAAPEKYTGFREVTPRR
jgi:hypothetical protein